MPLPKKIQRNKEIVKKRKQGWPFRKIANYYNINVKTVFDIYKRDVVGVYPQGQLDSVGK